MTKRINHFTTSPQAMEILLKQEDYLRQQFRSSTSVTETTWELIKLRVSQLNQCAFCIDMHSKDALQRGESPARIIGLSTWRDMPLYSVAERAALEWAERIQSGQPVADEQYQSALEALGPKSLVDLTLAINAISSWNSIGRTFKPEIGSYEVNNDKAR